MFKPRKWLGSLQVLGQHCSFSQHLFVTELSPGLLMKAQAALRIATLQEDPGFFGTPPPGAHGTPQGAAQTRLRCRRVMVGHQISTFLSPLKPLSRAGGVPRLARRVHLEGRLRNCSSTCSRFSSIRAASFSKSASWVGISSAAPEGPRRFFTIPPISAISGKCR